MSVRTICSRVSAFLKRHDPAVDARFDVGASLYPSADTEEPRFAYALRGRFRIDRRRILAALGLLLAARALLRRRR